MGQFKEAASTLTDEELREALAAFQSEQQRRFDKKKRIAVEKAIEALGAVSAFVNNKENSDFLKNVSTSIYNMFPELY